MGRGALSVMTTGASLMLELSAECWDLVMPSPLTDCKSNFLHSNVRLMEVNQTMPPDTIGRVLIARF